MKPLHAKWIIEMYHHLKRSKQIVISRFRKAHITEPVSEADQLAQLFIYLLFYLFIYSLFKVDKFTIKTDIILYTNKNSYVSIIKIKTC